MNKILIYIKGVIKDIFRISDSHLKNNNKIISDEIAKSVNSEPIKKVRKKYIIRKRMTVIASNKKENNGIQ